ncbi:META domain-containing protein [Cellulomonas sp. URHB0016]
MVDVDGTWRFTALAGADVGALGGRAPWLTFDGDGQVYGMAGVNRVRGTWTADGDTISFGPVVSTLMAGPPEATVCERAVLALLGARLTVAAPGTGELELSSAGGAAATLVRDDEVGRV